MANDRESQPRLMHKERKSGGQPNLAFVVDLWATPTGSVINDGEEPSSFLARREMLKETANNGNGAGIPLTVQSAMWATPRSSDGEKGGPNMRGSKGDMMLPSQSALWALPTTRERSGPSEEERNTPNIGLQAQRMTQAGKWFSRDNPNSPLRYQLQWRFVAWLMGLPCSLITPIE
jgi:hypothetical protein